MPRQLVVIGSSAGGIDALCVLLSGLPADFPAPIVIAQHIDPTRASHLADVLARSSTLPVRIVNGAPPLENGVVFVVPAGKHVQITDHQVRLVTDAHGRPKPSVDWLLTTAAQSFGEHVIAVILTGTGSDGAAGALEVKKAGGTVVVQNPKTARFPGMPGSLAPTVIDVVSELHQLPAVLRGLVSGAFQEGCDDHDLVLAGLLEELRQRNGIDFAAYKMPTILRRLRRRVAATGTNTLPEYIAYARANPDEYQSLVSTFLIKVTEFFRDKELFDRLRQSLLPPLIEQARARNHELRVWSSGCATGEEAFSLAILIADLLGDELDRFDVRIFATDLDGDAIAFGRRATYPETLLANIPPELVQRYFDSTNDGFATVKKRVRSMVVFGQHDLTQRAPISNIDLALFRNMLIYFTPELQRRSLRLFAFSVRAGGYLVLGKAETIRPVTEFFEADDSRLRVYQRNDKRVAPAPFASRTRRARPAAASAPQALEQAPASPRTLAGLLAGLPFGLVIINRRYIIESISAAAMPLLGIWSPAVGEDLIHLMRSLPKDVIQALIDHTFCHGVPTSADVVAHDLGTGQPRHLQVSCHPYERDELGGFSQAFLVLSDVTPIIRELEASRSVHVADIEESNHQQAQISRLSESNQDLMAGNQGMVTSIAKLRSTNDEYAISTEEHQATLEEIETLNEEIHASNEELETMNEELEASVEELKATNDDLLARTNETKQGGRISEPVVRGRG